jgi:hypothetical protein
MLARVRAAAGRVATVAGAAALTGALATDTLTLPGTLAIATTAAAGLATNLKLLRAPTTVRATAITLYTAPHAGCAVLLIGERLAPDSAGSVLVQAALAAAWTGATWYLRPGRVARDLVDEAAATETAETTEVEAAAEAPAYDSPQARWWGETFAGEGGIAPDTVLLDHQQVGEQCLALVIGAQKRGQPVPDISVPGLSAALDLPEDLIEIGPVPGRGAGLRLLVLGQRPQPAALEGGTDVEVWAEIAATAMPGVELLDAATYDVRKELT